MPQINVSQRIAELLKENKSDVAIQLFHSLLPKDQSEILRDLDGKSQAALIALLDEAILADVMDVMDDTTAALITRHMDIEQLVSVVDEMEPDKAADLLGDLDADIAGQALDKMATSEVVEPLLKYADHSAGGLMTSEYISFKGSARSADVLQGIRSMETDQLKVPYIFVVNDQGGLLGVVDLFQLITSKPDKLLENYTKSPVITVNVGDDREKAARLMAKYDLMALPVMDDRGLLTGVITVDDALEALEEETTEDFYNQVSIGAFSDRERAYSNNILRGSIWRALRNRAPFLVITLLGGMLAGMVMGQFEKALEAITGLAFFIPAIMDMGGNAGTQSSTFFTRALVLGQIQPHRFIKQWLRETAVGLVLGVMSGVLAGPIAAWWQPDIPNIGLVVSLSMVITITVSTSVGFMIPFLLHKAGTDQAAGSAPFITTVKDITGLLIYFLLVNAFIGIV